MKLHLAGAHMHDDGKATEELAWTCGNQTMAPLPFARGWGHGFIPFSDYSGADAWVRAELAQFNSFELVLILNYSIKKCFSPAS
jgi:hypothetical protein